MSGRTSQKNSDVQPGMEQIKVEERTMAEQTVVQQTVVQQGQQGEVRVAQNRMGVVQNGMGVVQNRMGVAQNGMGVQGVQNDIRSSGTSSITQPLTQPLTPPPRSSSPLGSPLCGSPLHRGNANPMSPLEHLAMERRVAEGNLNGNPGGNRSVESAAGSLLGVRIWLSINYDIDLITLLDLKML
jgi:hypothetical protein